MKDRVSLGQICILENKYVLFLKNDEKMESVENLLKRFAVGQRKRIEQEYKKLCEGLANYMTKEERTKIDRAFQFALEAHQNVFRKSDEPYILHPLRVAQTVAIDLKLDSICVISALLHDVVEDTAIPLVTVKKLFGNKVGDIVDGLTKINENTLWYQSAQAENFRRIMFHIGKDKRVIFVKLADRLDNMYDIEWLPKNKQWKIVSETKLIYAPIAHRLGLSNIKGNLEDMCFKTLNPDLYYKIATKLTKRLEEREEELNDFIKPIEKALQDASLTYRISSRPKSIFSIYKKTEKKNIKLNDLYDLIAIRIVLYTEQEMIECWRTYGIVTSIYPPNNRRKKDWLSTPRSNGYESLHITVMSKKGNWVEVQIRTKRMDTIATRGVASHWKYKGESSNEFMNIFDKWLHDVTRGTSEEKDSLKVMENLEWALYMDEIYVFDKQGKPIALPKEATILDFSVEKLGKDGLFCEYGLVNDQIVPISHRLKDGDRVKLKINKENAPKENALDFVITPSARYQIRKFFEKSYRKRIMTGKTLLKEKLKGYNINLSSTVIEHLKEFLNEEIVENMYYKIGKEKMNDIDGMIKKFVNSFNGDLTCFEESSLSYSSKKKVFFVGDNNETYEMATCCNPVPGEEIFGIIMLNKKAKIHGLRCKNRNRMLSRYGSRMTPVSWYNPLPVQIKFIIKAINSKGITKHVLDVLKGFNVQTFIWDGKKAENLKATTQIIMRDIAEVNYFMERVKAVTGVKTITRE